MKKATKVYKVLYKKSLILGLPTKLIAIETALGGIVVFVLRNIIIALMMIITHAVLGIILLKENEINKIINFWLSINSEDYTRNKNKCKNHF